MVRILADQYKLRQVVRNLVSNALKFTSKPGTVKVVVDVISADSDEVARLLADIKGMAKSCFYLRISVTDSGCGISKENQAQLFGGIIQFNPGQLQQGKGTGLGLFISKGIVDMHKGHLWVESDGEGHGATFTVLLPLEFDRSSSKDTLAIQDSQFISKPKMTHFSKSDKNNSARKIIPVTVNSMKSDVVDVEFVSGQLYSFSSLALEADEGSHIVDEILNLKSMQEATEPSIGKTFIFLSSYNHRPVYVCTIKYELTNRLYCLMVGVHSVVETESLVRQRINVLVVDDSKSCRTMTRKAIMASGKVDTDVCCDMAADGSLAVDLVRHNMEVYDSLSLSNTTLQSVPPSMVHSGMTCLGAYDLILMDYQMPVMDGPTAIKAIRTLGFKGKIVGLTGNALQSEQNVMLDAGAELVLTKPVNAGDLESVLNLVK